MRGSRCAEGEVVSDDDGFDGDGLGKGLLIAVVVIIALAVLFT